MTNELYFTVGILGLSWILVVLGTALIPFYNRKGIAFGISVPESEYHSEFFRTLRHRYFAACLIFGVILAVGSSLAFIWLSVKTAMWIHLAAIFGYLLITACLYLVSYRRVRTYKQNSHWQMEKTAAAVLTWDKDEKKPLSYWWFLTYGAVIAVTMAAVYIKYPSLPAQIPMHYNISGEVDRYAAKSISTFVLMPIIQSLIGLLFFGANFAVLNSKRQGGVGDIKDIEAGLKKDRAFQIVMSKSLFFIGLMTTLLFSIIQLSMLQILDQQAVIIAPGVFLAIIFGLIIYLYTKIGQGGSRIKGRGSIKGRSGAVSNVVEDDSRWILGTLYYNKNDPSLFVEKRFGMGYTINLGNPKSWLAILALLALIVVSVVLPLKLH